MIPNGSSSAQTDTSEADLIPNGIIGEDQRAIIITDWRHERRLRAQFPDRRRVHICGPTGGVVGRRTDIVVFYDVDPWDFDDCPTERSADLMERYISESLVTRFSIEAFYAGCPMVFL